MIKYIPRGVKVTPDGEWQGTPEIGVRETPGDCCGEIELTQDLTEVGGEVVEQYIELSHGQMKTLRDYLTVKLAELDSQHDG